MTYLEALINAAIVVGVASAAVSLPIAWVFYSTGKDHHPIVTGIPLLVGAVFFLSLIVYL
jgi:hypothetical protein